ERIVDWPRDVRAQVLEMLGLEGAR
ncbi:MAG: hypothetical protein JWR59_1930, partial [Brevundimonas sp.]|nr:hypothetical protein [Brevundimonas sp.]